MGRKSGMNKSGDSANALREESGVMLEEFPVGRAAEQSTEHLEPLTNIGITARKLIRK
jgi:hypothetical protein